MLVQINWSVRSYFLHQLQDHNSDNGNVKSSDWLICHLTSFFSIIYLSIVIQLTCNLCHEASSLILIIPPRLSIDKVRKLKRFDSLDLESAEFSNSHHPSKVGLPWLILINDHHFSHTVFFPSLFLSYICICGDACITNCWLVYDP